MDSECRSKEECQPLQPYGSAERRAILMSQTRLSTCTAHTRHDACLKDVSHSLSDVWTNPCDCALLAGIPLELARSLLLTSAPDQPFRLHDKRSVPLLLIVFKLLCRWWLFDVRLQAWWISAPPPPFRYRSIS